MAPGALDRRAVWGVLAVATLVAAALRLPFLDHQSLWLDETFTRGVVGESSLSGLWDQLKATESTPPLYYLVAWLTGAYSAAELRAIPALALIAAVPVSYFAFRRWVGQRAALATAAILAVNPLLVAFATDARSYGLLVLTALLSLWAFATLLERGSPARYALWVAASLACVWTHYFGAFVVGTEVVALLAMRPDARRATAGWTALLGAGALALLPLVTSQTGDERAEFIAGIPLETRLSDTVRQLAMGANVPVAWLEAAGLVLVCAAAGVGAVLAVRARGGGPRLILVFAAIVVGAPLVMAVAGIEDRFYARNVIIALPLLAALAATALLRLRAVPLATYLVLATVTSIQVATDWRYEQTDWRGALARVQSIDRDAAVVAVTGTNAPTVADYLARPPAPASGVDATRAWIVMEPVRTAGERALGPSPAPRPPLPGFAPVRSVEVHGFRLILLRASQPTRIAPATLPGATVFAGG